jgi:antitoxin (DNA-binding transcriptional repressor) of toxin-antitoxin stability system
LAPGQSGSKISLTTKAHVITVTEAARNFADVNRAYYQNTTFVLLKNGVPYARIVPENAKRCTGRELAEALGQTELSVAKARAWNHDRKTARKILR